MTGFDGGVGAAAAAEVRFSSVEEEYTLESEVVKTIIIAAHKKVVFTHAAAAARLDGGGDLRQWQ